MTDSLLESIEKRFPQAVQTKCAESGCKLILDRKKLGTFLLLKGESVRPGKPACDCIIFIPPKESEKEKGKIIVGLTELKSKTVHVSHVCNQLTGGLNFALELLYDKGINAKGFKCYAMVVAKKWNTPEYKLLTSKKLVYRGVKYRILPKKCGASFADIISG